MSKVVARIYPYANPSQGPFKNLSIYDAGCGGRGDGRGRRFNNRGCGRGREVRGGKGRRGNVQGGCVGGSGAHENGIDISDVTRYFEYSE